MQDMYGRKIEYMRISVTQKCNLKCIYCEPDCTPALKAACGILTPVEFGRVVEAASQLGIRHVRITGGEPLTRPDICEIIKNISVIPEINDISMTTNGIYLPKMAEKLRAAGLGRLNISLDSLKEDRFSYISGGGKLEAALEGIENSIKAGFTAIRINVVLIKGVNDDEIDDFIQLAADRPIDVRFIELMPIGRFGENNKGRIVLNSEIINSRPYLRKLENMEVGQPATYYSIEGFKGRIGFISPMSHKFCDRCNRIRLTCDGKIKPCLGDNGEVNILEILRKHPELLEKTIQEAIYHKPQGHSFEKGFSSSRNMNAIGG